MLAHFLNHYPAQLRADFQEFYGLNIDGMGREYSTLHAADLAAMLPRKSRVFVEIEPANSWGQAEWMLAGIHYFTHVNVWAQTKEAQRKHKPPFDPPEPPKKKQPKQLHLDTKAIDERLSMPRKAVNNAN